MVCELYLPLPIPLMLALDICPPQANPNNYNIITICNLLQPKGFHLSLRPCGTVTLSWLVWAGGTCTLGMSTVWTNETSPCTC